MRLLPLVTQGHECPRCGRHTERVRIPFFLRPVRLAWREVQRRRCRGPRCGWHGFALPEEHARHRVDTTLSSVRS